MEKKENEVSKVEEKDVKKKSLEKKESGQVKKKNIVPSYEKKSSSIDESRKINKNKKRVKSKISIIIIVMILIIFLLGILYGIYSIVNYNSNKKYKEYESTISIWGFDKMYDNNQASFYESVTKSEAVKLIISSTLNISDITDYYQLENSNYDNEIWIKYAESFEVLTENEINSENEDEKITLIEFLRILSKAKTKILGLDLDIEELTKYNFVEKSNNDDQAILKDMIYNKILVDIKDNTNINKKISKGMCNQLLYNYIKKYNTITLDGAKLNINAEKLPSNAEDYPYILANINKSVYEKRFKYKNVDESKTPIEIYANMKDKYKEVKYLIEDYLDLMFNVNYENINKEKYINVLADVLGNAETTINSTNSAFVDNYISFVKENKIKIEGVYKIQDPIFYFDGVYYRVRVSVSYNINSNTLNNVLYMDANESKNIVYKAGENQSYYDIKLRVDENNMLYIVSESLSNQEVN